MLKLSGKDFQVGVKNLSPLSLSNDLDVNSILTIDEGRAILGYAPSEDEEKGKQLIKTTMKNDVTTVDQP